MNEDLAPPPGAPTGPAPGGIAAGETVVRTWHRSLATRLAQVLFGVALMTTGAVTGLAQLVPWPAGVGIFLVGLVIFGVAWMLCRSTRYSVTTLRIRREEGILGRNSWETALRDVRNVSVRQSGTERMFGIGTVEFTSAGGPYVDVRFEGVRRPQEVSELVWNLKQKQQLG